MARRATRMTWVTNTPSITAAQTRCTRPAPWKPPNALDKVTAQGRSAKISGSPESAQPTKLSMSSACSMRSVAVKRRYQRPSEVVAAAAAALACVMAVHSLNARSGAGTC